MFDKLEEVEALYEELEKRMSDPTLVNDMDEYRRVHKQYSDLTEIVAAYREYKSTLRQLDETEQMLKGSLDDDMRDLAQMELDELKSSRTSMEERLKVLLLPKDPNDEKDVILEVRAAAGGDEAALFAGDLIRMYMRYAEKQGWSYEFSNVNETGNNGYKEAIMEVHGQGAYSKLKFESAYSGFRRPRRPAVSIPAPPLSSSCPRPRMSRSRSTLPTSSASTRSVKARAARTFRRTKPPCA
jgi:peptide chain release factor 1